MSELKQLLNVARKAGWKVRQSRRNAHWRLTPPDSTQPHIYVSATCGDHRGMRNARATLRRAGLHV